MAAIFSTVTMATMTKVWSVCVVADRSLGNITVMLSSWTLVHIYKATRNWERSSMISWPKATVSQEGEYLHLEYKMKENHLKELALSYQFDTCHQSTLPDRHRRVCWQWRCMHSLRCDKEMVVHKVMGSLSKGQIVCSHRHVLTRLPVTIQTLCACVKERRKTELAAWGKKSAHSTRRD